MPQINDITSGAALFVHLVFPILISKLRYEVFYLGHIFMYIVFLVKISFHHPENRQGGYHYHCRRCNVGC
jgi:hypothetical protein